jgi:3-oxoacyl-[acyl-carrier protein] reductase
MDSDLSGQRAVVTGAARGIGLGIAHRLAELGVQVCSWDTDNRPIESDAAIAHRCEVDVADETSVARAADETLAVLERIDILVNNAGVNGPTKPAWEYTVADWQRVINIDLTGVFLCSRALAPHMRDNRYGRMITVASIAGKEGNPDACAYAAAKAGVIGFCKTLARELVDAGVTVNYVTPVITETDLFDEMSEAYIADRKSRIPMGRFCRIEEIADTVAWIASPRCSFTTGACFDVSGGRATY